MALLTLSVGLIVGAVVLAGVLFVGWIWIDHRRQTKKFLKTSSDASIAPGMPVSFNGGWSITVLLELEWHRFEQVVAAYEEELGHAVQLQGFGMRGGVVARVSDSPTGKVERLIQCKVFDDDNVDEPLVRELHDAMIGENVGQGTFYTTTAFTAAARSAAGKARIELISGREFLTRMSRLSPEAQTRLFELALAPHHRVPTCPNCGVKMILREPVQRPKFWACPDMPKCNAILEPRKR